MTYHVPVLLPQCIEGLRILPDGVYVDATMGGGGHTRAILERLGDRGVLFGFDQDASAAINVPDDERFHFVHGNFRDLGGILDSLGISSYQFDTPERGFTFRSPAALDMRMNSSSRLTAADVVNTYDQEQLCRIFRDYGEIANAGRLAALIVRGRSESPIETSSRLTDLIAPCTPPHGEFKYWAKVFQALRRQAFHPGRPVLGPGRKRLLWQPAGTVQGTRKQSHHPRRKRNCTEPARTKRQTAHRR